MRAVLCKLAIVASLVLGLVQLSAAAYAHEAATSPSQSAASALSTAEPAYMPDYPSLSEADGPADVEVQCSDVFLAGEAVAIRSPTIGRSRHHSAADSDITRFLPSPDPPPPRF